MTSRDRPESHQDPTWRVSTDKPEAAKRSRRARSGVDPVLVSKITVPGVPDWVVPRPRVTGLIGEGVRWCPLTVLTGPAGAGKTLALASWAAGEGGPVAWVRLDEFDNRPGLFWSYVGAALRRCGVAVPAVVPGRGGEERFLVRLAAVLAESGRPVRLVLDDLHLVGEPAVLKGLDFVVRGAGGGVRVVVASRMDPLLPLHRYRVAGRLAEVRAADLAFGVAEAGQLLARHGIAVSGESLGCLVARTEGWAAGLRLAALSMGGRADPEVFVRELGAEDSALTGYLVDEVLAGLPGEARQVLTWTSVLGEVSAEAAAVLTGRERAAGVFAGLARGNAFIVPTGPGRYRYHGLFAEVLRLKLRREDPGRVGVLHQRAAGWLAGQGQVAEAVRHAGLAGDWLLAARLVVAGLAVGELLGPSPDGRLAAGLAGMPGGQGWADPAPYLVTAALALAAGRDRACAAALAAADRLLDQVPDARPAADRLAGQVPDARRAADGLAGQVPDGRRAADRLAGQVPGGQAEARLAAALIRLSAGLRAGDLTAAAAAVAQAEMLLDRIPGDTLARHPGIRARILTGRGAVELWSGRLDEAARILEPAQAAAAGYGAAARQAAGIGHLALAEAMRGRLGRAAELAGTAQQTGEDGPQGQDQDPTALVAVAWVHLYRNELREMHSCLRRADTALAVSPDQLTGAAACLVAAIGALAEGRAEEAAQIVATARSAWPVPAWLDQQLSLVESRACATAGDSQAALAAVKRADCDDSPEAAVALAYAWAAAGDGDSARRVLAPVREAGRRVPDRMRLHAWLVDARLSYASGDPVRGRRSLAAALRLAEPEQLRLPFALERSWIGPVLPREPELASAYRGLLPVGLRRQPLPDSASVPDHAPVRVLEPLSERELEVLRHVSGMLSTAEVASEMYLSVNTVKTHLRNIYRKLAASHRAEAVRRARRLELI